MKRGGTWMWQGGNSRRQPATKPAGSRPARTKRGSQGAGSTPATLDYEEVARVAYGLWEQRGGAHGSDAQDWFEAEGIVQARQRNASAR